MTNTETLRALPRKWRERAKKLRLSGNPYRNTADSLSDCADDLEQALSAGDGVAVFTNDGNEEQRFIEHESLSCPHCGGSGHRDDVAAAPVYIPAGWRLIRTQVGEIVVSGPNGGPIVRADDTLLPRRTLYELADALLTGGAAQVAECQACEPEGIFATDGAGPFDCYVCGKKAAPAVEVDEAFIERFGDEILGIAGEAYESNRKARATRVIAALTAALVPGGCGMIERSSHLYHAANRMMAAIGSNGEINSRHEAVYEVMEALREIDGGRYESEFVPAFLDRIAAELVLRDPGPHSNQIAASLQGRAIILRHVDKENRRERPL